MGTELPPITTERLEIRPLTISDLPEVHGVLVRAWNEGDASSAASLARRERWLRWTVLSYEELAALNQAPYGDRAACLRDTGQMIGCVGLVPSLGPFDQLTRLTGSPAASYFSPEVGLFWAIDPHFQGAGFATEAASALIHATFSLLNLGRIVATTEYRNVASIGVMKRLGMKILQNPLSEPEWFQVVGILERDNRLLPRS